jgi:hypothetical protein
VYRGTARDLRGLECSEYCWYSSTTVLREEALKTALGRLCKQKAAGVDTTTNVFLRQTFRDGDADTFGTVLYPFASMCLAGTIHQEAMAFLLASRLALVPKVDDEAPPTGQGAARQPLARLSAARNRGLYHETHQHRRLQRRRVGGGARPSTGAGRRTHHGRHVHHGGPRPGHLHGRKGRGRRRGRT